MSSVTLYEKVSSFATSKNAGWYLFIIAFAESTFFPIPPDVLLIPLCILVPKRAFSFALMTTSGSVLGGSIGYMIGMLFQDSIGMNIINFYGFADKYAEIEAWYQAHSFLIISAAGFSPIPYKIFTITSGMFDVNFTNFLIGSIFSRGARFFLIAWLIWRGGPKLKNWIEKNLYAVTMVSAIALVLGVVLFKLLLK